MIIATIAEQDGAILTEGTHVGPYEIHVQLFPDLGRREQVVGFTASPTASDVSPDGRFLMTETLDPPSQPVTRMRIVLNWVEELRRAQASRQ